MPQIGTPQQVWPNGRLTKQRNKYALRIGLTLTLLLTGLLSAQSPPALYSVNNQTQTPIPGVGHDYQHLLGETVNFSNGSVSFKLSFPVPRGRGITIPYAWTYSSAAVNPLDAVDGMSPTWDDTSFHRWPELDGWNLYDGMPLATQQVWQVVGSGVNPRTGIVESNDTWIPCNFLSGMTFTDMQGVKHNLKTEAQSPAFFNDMDASYIYTCNGAYTTPPNGDGQVIATLNPNTADSDRNNPYTASYLRSSSPQGGNFDVMDKNGTVYHFPSLANYPSSPNNEQPPMSIVDRNGNSAGYDQSKNAWVDSLGRPYAYKSGNPTGAASSTVTVTAGGMSYSSTWSTVSVNYVSAGNIPTYSVQKCFPWNSTVSGTRNVLSTLTLPTGQMYQLFYGTNSSDSTIQNNFGLLNEIIFPDGGWIKYKWTLPPAGASPDSQYNESASLGGENFSDYGGKTTTIPVGYGCNWQYRTPVLSRRTVSFDGQRIAQTQDFTYGTTWAYASDGSVNGWSQKQTTVVTTDSLRGGISSKTVYTYTPMIAANGGLGGSHIAPQIPMESSIVYYDWGQTTPLKSVQKTWQDQFNLTREITTVYSAGGGTRVSGTEYKYTSNLCNEIPLQFSPSISMNPVGTLIYMTEQDDFDYGSGKLGLLYKKTLYDYRCFQPPFPQSGAPVSTIAPEVASVTVEDGNGRIVDATQYDFDKSSLVGVTAINHDSSFDSAAVHGNVTSVTKCSQLPVNPKAVCSGPTTHITYDTTGQPATVVDPKGNQTDYSFVDQFTDTPPSTNTNAYLTKVKLPVISGVRLEKNFKYSYALGFLTSAADENGQTTSYSYNTNAGCSSSTPDGMFRLGEVDSPIGKTTFCYDDAGHTTTKNVLLDTASGNRWMTTITTSDGMGQAIRSELHSDPDGPTFTDTQVDGEGQVLTVTNPYRGQASGVPLTTHYYDALGRKVATKEPAIGSSQDLQLWCFNGIPSSAAPSTNCSSQLGSVGSSSRPGTWVDYTDERGNQWQRTTDAFANLLSVMEPNGTSHSPTMETDYAYDVLGNLTSVAQYGGAYGSSNARTRAFRYNSLSQLINSYNPETGTIQYTYDLNGNLDTKTDARGVAIKYGYDALNRLLGKTYTGDSSGTPASCFQYGASSDTQNFTGGRLVNSWTQSAQSCPGSPGTFLTRRQIQQYDPMGRVLVEQQFTLASQAGAILYKPKYTYYSDGSLHTAEDGLTKAASAGVDLLLTYNVGTAGRVQTVASNWSDATHPAALFSQPASPGPCTTPQTGQYWPSGSLANALFGAGITFSRSLDSRLRANCEADQGTGTRPATPGSATISITGAEQSK